MKLKIVFTLLFIIRLSLSFSQEIKAYKDSNYRFSNGTAKVKYKKTTENRMSGKTTVYTPFGEAKYYDQFDNLRIEGQYKNGHQVGVWKHYFENGNIKSYLEFSENGKTSYTKIYYENGQLFSEGKSIKSSYDEWYKYGDWILYYKNGQVAEKGKFDLTYYDGSIEGNEKIGTWTTYYLNGNIETEKSYSKIKDRYGDYEYKITGISKYNYENGKPFKIRYDDKRGEHIKIEYYYKNGIKRIIIPDEYDKNWQVFDDEGNTAELIYYDKDWKIVSHKSDAEFYRIYNPNKNGTCRIVRDYYENSHKLQAAVYTKYVDIKDESKTLKCQGISYNYYDDKEDEYYSSNPLNRMRTQGTFDNQGKIDGELKVYFYNGKIKTIASFKSGKRVGLWKRFNEDGTLKSEEKYENGEKIKQ